MTYGNKSSHYLIYLFKNKKVKILINLIDDDRCIRMYGNCNRIQLCTKYKLTVTIFTVHLKSSPVHNITECDIFVKTVTCQYTEPNVSAIWQWEVTK